MFMIKIFYSLANFFLQTNLIIKKNGIQAWSKSLINKSLKNDTSVEIMYSMLTFPQWRQIKQFALAH